MKNPFEEKLLLYKVREKQDTEAFGTFYDIYVAELYRFVYFKLNNREEAEDVVSEVFLRIWQYLIDREKKEVESFRALSYAIARNAIIDVYRRRKRDQDKMNMQMGGENVVVDIELNVGMKLEADNIMSVVATFKQEYQEVIHLRHIEGLPMKDIAKILNKSHTSVRVLLHRATKKLKNTLQSSYEEPKRTTQKFEK